MQSCSYRTLERLQSSSVYYLIYPTRILSLPSHLTKVPWIVRCSQKDPARFYCLLPYTSWKKCPLEFVRLRLQRRWQSQWATCLRSPLQRLCTRTIPRTSSRRTIQEAQLEPKFQYTSKKFEWRGLSARNKRVFHHPGDLGLISHFLYSISR